MDTTINITNNEEVDCEESIFCSDSQSSESNSSSTESDSSSSGLIYSAEKYILDESSEHLKKTSHIYVPPSNQYVFGLESDDNLLERTPEILDISSDELEIKLNKILQKPSYNSWENVDRPKDWKVGTGQLELIDPDGFSTLNNVRILVDGAGTISKVKNTYRRKLDLPSEMGRQFTIDGDCQEQETRMREVGDVMVENLYPIDDDLVTPSIINDDDNFFNMNRRTRRKKATNKFNRRLWFIPTHVLNNREDQGKGKRQCLTTYTRLSCRECNTTFHTSVGFRLHSHRPPFYPTVVGGWDSFYFTNFLLVASTHRQMDPSEVHTLLWKKWSGNSQATRPKKLRKV